jgi:hypothetical protein
MTVHLDVDDGWQTGLFILRMCVLLLRTSVSHIFSTKHNIGRLGYYRYRSIIQ